MRISTGMIYGNGVAAIQKRTNSLLATQQQISSGRRMQTAADDPVAAARALELTQAKDINADQAKTRDSAKNSLGIVDAQLSSTTELLARVRELAVQGGSAALSDTDRRIVAKELRTRFDEIVALANSTDGTGNYLFAGFQSGNKPFAGSVADGVTYSGDSGLRSLMVSSSRSLPISDSGNDIFMGISNGNGVFATGTQNEKSIIAPPLTINAGSVADAAAWSTLPVGGVELRFWKDPAGADFYDLVDSGGVSMFTGTMSFTGVGGTYDHAYTSGAPITLTSLPMFDFGATVTVSGTPADGDAFSIQSTLTGGIATAAVAVHQIPVIDKGLVTDPVEWSSADNSGNLEVRFWVDNAGVMGGGPNATYYDLVDATDGNSLFTGGASTVGAGGTFTHTFTSGAAIPFSGLNAAYNAPSNSFGASVTVTGQPATGDAFTVKRSTDAIGNGDFVTAPKTTARLNAGSGVIGAGEVLDLEKWNNTANSRNIEIRFSRTAAGLAYDLVDVETEKSLFTDTVSVAGGVATTYTHIFTAGNAVPFTGLNAAYGGDLGIAVTINGTPADGDAFSVKASASKSVFDTIGDLVKTLEAPNPGGTSGNTQRANQIASVLANLSQAEDNILRVRAVIGSSLNEVENLDSVGSSLDLQYTQSLSNLQDVDYATAITNLTRQQVELQAAQQSFVKISQLSLFSYL